MGACLFPWARACVHVPVSTGSTSARLTSGAASMHCTLYAILARAPCLATSTDHPKKLLVQYPVQSFASRHVHAPQRHAMSEGGGQGSESSAASDVEDLEILQPAQGLRQRAQCHTPAAGELPQCLTLAN
eukprot:CAMPEP_0174761022 /NCGR_PEP_ID=MMETSP1094-20130205/109068_1 /TAXON_ID=156173 /ORGANISM="Chrysochromulina brevifilum, Strain UTEX LB 985" /LENGTH=129 /DNA_ID=CAMNT_0015966969 /DNA_START=92 /DNA_END=482 /DNA_ORIENTATION=+